MGLFNSYENLSFVGFCCMSIAIIAFGVLMLFVALLLVERQYGGGDMKKKRSEVMIALLAVLVMCLSLWGSVSAKTAAHERLLGYVASGYTVYIDGREVDGNNIDILQYSASVDEEGELIYLTQKQRRRMIFVPFVWR